MAPLIIFLFGIIIYPMASSLYSSFSVVKLSPYQINFAGLQNYINIFSDQYFFHSLSVTARFVGEVVVITIGLSLGIALFLNEVLPFRGIIRAIILLPYTLLEFTTAYTRRWFLSSDWGLLNGILYRLGLIKEYIYGSLITSTQSDGWQQPIHGISYLFMHFSCWLDFKPFQKHYTCRRR